MYVSLYIRVYAVACQLTLRAAKYNV